jgi:hypothetical protein
MRALGAVVANVVTWVLAYRWLARRFSSPFVFVNVLTAVSTIGAGLFTSAFSLPERDYLVVVPIPSLLTVIVTVRAGLRRRSSRLGRPG